MDSKTIKARKASRRIFLTLVTRRIVGLVNCNDDGRAANENDGDLAVGAATRAADKSS